MRAHHCADIERPKHRAYESCVIANLFLGRCLTFFRVEFLIFWIQKMSRVQNRIRTITTISKADFIRWCTHFFALSRLDAVNTNIALGNTDYNTIQRCAKSCTNIFFTQILGHFKSPLRQPFSKTFCIRASHMRSRRLFLTYEYIPRHHVCPCVICAISPPAFRLRRFLLFYRLTFLP